MRKIAATLLVLTLFTLPYMFTPPPVSASARTIIVPDSFSTIQTAITNANTGDTILVKPSTYSENVTVDKPLFLKGENPTSTIIKGAITVNAPNVTIESLTIEGQGWNQLPPYTCGLLITGSYHTTTSVLVRNCVITGWTTAIIMSEVNGNKIVNNTFLGSGFGVEFGGSDNIISYNNILASMGGISLSQQHMSNNLVFRNTISDAQKGIIVNDNTNNQFFENTIARCEVGIELGIYPEGFGPRSDNKIVHNNFVDNIQHALAGVGSGNVWDDGYPSGGNYWSDHDNIDVKTGQDQAEIGSDGVADTGRVISSGNVDNYPLTEPFVFEDTGYRLIDFTDTFRDSVGNVLYAAPSCFNLIFPNGSTSGLMAPGIHQVPVGVTVLDSVMWQGTEVKPEEKVVFNPLEGNPVIDCRVYSLTVNPLFYDKDGAQIEPTTWTIKFPNGTLCTVSSSTVAFAQVQTGWYRINSVQFQGLDVEVGGELWLRSSEIWVPEMTAYVAPVLLYDVNSNSVVSELAFNQTEQALSFLVSGEEGTSGYAIVRIAKTLTDGNVDFTVYLDDERIVYELDSTEFAWILTVNYTHSTHRIVITFAAVAQWLGLFPILFVGLIVVGLAVLGLLIYLKKRRREKCS